MVKVGIAWEQNPIPKGWVFRLGLFMVDPDPYNGEYVITAFPTNIDAFVGKLAITDLGKP